MDTTTYEELQGRLYGLLIRLGDRFADEDARQFHEFIDVDEFGLALEQMAGALAGTGAAITDGERTDMLMLVHMMHMDDLVPRALAACPSADAAGAC